MRESLPSRREGGDSEKRAIKQALAAFLHAVVADNEIIRRPYTQESGVDQVIVSHNLEMMEEPMNDLAQDESVGGNAGSVNIDGESFNCVALNGYADKETGKILAFGNSQHIPPAISSIGIEFTFREAQIGPREMAAAFNNRADKTQDVNTFFANYKGREKKIVDFFGAKQFSERGRNNIEAAIHIYNEKYWSSRKAN